MIDTRFDPTQPYVAVLYLRMSSDQQNPRSPETQEKEIRDTLRRLGYPWQIIRVFRDDAVSGRKIRGRRGFTEMIELIETGVLKADLILVDMLERFSRTDNVDEIRRKLQSRHGTLILTADSRFADPTNAAGKALGMIETIRSTQAATEKAHTVRRGKRYVAAKGHWPGGPPALGYQLKSIMKAGSGPQEVDYRLLIVDPESAPIIRLMFRLSHERGMGACQIGRHLNADTAIASKFKPFQTSTIHRALQNPIYKGVLQWGKLQTAMVEDMRVVRKNRPDEVTWFKDFCEPLVDPAVFDAVNQRRELRGAKIKEARNRNTPEKLIAPIARGLVLKYPLSGLVRCGCCGASMRCSVTGSNAKSQRYRYYACPNAASCICDNGKYIHMSWLQSQVMSHLRDRLLPAPGLTGSMPDWLDPLLDEVRNELRRLHKSDTGSLPILESEFAQLETKIAGWTQSLGVPTLSQELRRRIEFEYDEVVKRQTAIQQDINLIESAEACQDRLLDVTQVIAKLQRLDTVLDSGNPTEVNMELSRHIERIEAFPDGRVIMRTCRLGMFEGLVRRLDLPLSDCSPPDPTQTAEVGQEQQAGSDPSVLAAGEMVATDAHPPKPGDRSNSAPIRHQVKPRARVPLACRDSIIPTRGDSMLGDSKLPNLTNLPAHWFWTDEFKPHQSSFWAKDNAAAVAAAKAEHPEWNQETLAKHFGVTRPTIRYALHLAAGGMPRQKPPATKAARPADASSIAPVSPNITLDRPPAENMRTAS